MIGTDTDTYEDELEKRLNEILDRARDDNEEEAREVTTDFLKSNFEQVDTRLRNNEFEGFEQFDVEIEAFKGFCFENAPSGPQRQELILDFIAKQKADAAYRFIQAKEQEMKMQKQLAAERIEKLESEKKEIKKERVEEGEEMGQRM